MKSLLCSDSFVYSAMLIIAIAGFSAAELEQSKNRRAGGTSGLFAFPRVGRSDPSMNNNNNNNLHETETYESMYTNSLEDYDEFAKNEMKRASLIAFPRVGRNDAEIRKWARMMALQQALDKRAGPSATSGLWFGPRLGKRSVTKSDYEATKNMQKEMV